ncbi:MAG: histidine--tRNA ligase [Actinomycetota bacterium]
MPRGFIDAAGQDVLQRTSMIDTILPVYRTFGFQPLESPLIEYLDALGKFLPDKDRPGEGVFALRDEDDQWMALRYDLTAPLARYVAEHRNDLTLPYRRYQVGPVFRQEKPGPGRFRQFYQCDFDTVGSKSMAVDAEACAIMATALEQLGVERGDYIVRLNDRNVLNGVLALAGLPAPGPDDDAETATAAVARRAHVLRSMDKLDRLGPAAVRELLGPGRTDASGDVAEGVGLADDQIDIILGFVTVGEGETDRQKVLSRLRDLVGKEPEGVVGVEELETIDGLLTAMGLGSDQVIIDTSVVRGLDYYTGPVFETELTYGPQADGSEAPSFGTVASGGRYDDLVKRFTGQEVPACGASIGVDRLLTALRAIDKLEQSALDGPIVVTIMDRERLTDYQAMVSELRQAGIAAELYLGNPKNLGNQLKYADRRRSPAAVIVGSDEFDAGTVVIKNLAYGKEVSKGIDDRQEWLDAADVQETVPRDRLVATIAALVD